MKCASIKEENSFLSKSVEKVSSYKEETKLEIDDGSVSNSSVEEDKKISSKAKSITDSSL